MKNYRITVAGTGYVGLSIAVLLSQHHKVTAVDVVPEKVEMINHRKSPIQDEYIEKYLAEKNLDLIREQKLKELEDHLTAAVELAAQCGVSSGELTEMLHILQKEDPSL